MRFFNQSSLSTEQIKNRQLLEVLISGQEEQMLAVQQVLFDASDFNDEGNELNAKAQVVWDDIVAGKKSLTFEQLHEVITVLDQKKMALHPELVKNKAGQSKSPFSNAGFYDFLRNQDDVVPAMQEQLRVLRERVKKERGFISKAFNIFSSEKPLEQVTKDLMSFEKYCKRYGISFDDVNNALIGGDRMHPALSAVTDFRFLLAAVGGGLLGLGGYASGVDIMSHLPEAAGDVPGLFFKGLPYMALPFISLSIFRAFSQKSLIKEAPTVARFVGMMSIGIMIGIGVTGALGGWLPEIDQSMLQDVVNGAEEGADADRPFSPSQYILHGIITSALFASVYRKTKQLGQAGEQAVMRSKNMLVRAKDGFERKVLKPLFNAVAAPVNKVGRLMEKAADGMDKTFNHYMNFVGIPAIGIMMTALMNQGGMGELANYGGYYGVMAACMATCTVALGALAYVHGARKQEFTEILKTGATAFGISSSAATMPVTKEGLKKMGVASHIRESVVPLGANFNMMGTAMFLGGTAICAAKMMGLEPSFADTMAAMAIAVSTAFGAPGAPASMVIFLDPVLTKLGLSSAQNTEIYKMIIPGERLLDMTQTAQNVTGDQIVALNTEAWEKNEGLRKLVPITRENPAREAPKPAA